MKVRSSIGVVALLLVLGMWLSCRRQDDAPQVVPYRIVEVKEQPRINQRLVSVVVPPTATLDEIKRWHFEIRKKYSGGGNLFLNFYRGHRAADQLWYTDDGKGSLISLDDRESLKGTNFEY